MIVSVEDKIAVRLHHEDKASIWRFPTVIVKKRFAGIQSIGHNYPSVFTSMAEHAIATSGDEAAFARLAEVREPDSTGIADQRRGPGGGVPRRVLRKRAYRGVNIN
jgi:hypothetical protein